MDCKVAAGRSLIWKEMVFVKVPRSYNPPDMPSRGVHLAWAFYVVPGNLSLIPRITGGHTHHRAISPIMQETESQAGPWAEQVFGTAWPVSIAITGSTLSDRGIVWTV